VIERDETEREAAIACIESAFAGVTRDEGAISWNECVAHDHYESEEACLAARRSDTDTHWGQLVDDPDWLPFPGIGGFCFINVEGFMYYLPPTMIRFLRGDNSEWYPGHLLRVIKEFTDQDNISRWAEDQLRCIARFIAYMSRHDPDLCPDEPNPWAEAMESRWKAYLQ
jgi:hypothetical protein